MVEPAVVGPELVVAAVVVLAVWEGGQVEGAVTEGQLQGLEVRLGQPWERPG